MKDLYGRKKESVNCLKCGSPVGVTTFVTRGGRVGGFLCCSCSYSREGTCGTIEELKAHLETLPTWDGEFFYDVGEQFGWPVNKEWMAATIVACLPPFHSASKSVEGAESLPSMDRSSRARYILKCVKGDRVCYRSPTLGYFEKTLSEMEAMG